MTFALSRTRPTEFTFRIIALTIVNLYSLRKFPYDRVVIDSEPLSRYDVKQETKIKYTTFTIDVNLTAEFEQCPF